MTESSRARAKAVLTPDVSRAVGAGKSLIFAAVNVNTTRPLWPLNGDRYRYRSRHRYRYKYCSADSLYLVNVTQCGFSVWFLSLVSVGCTRSHQPAHPGHMRTD